MQIPERFKDPVVNIALDTIEKKKQALVFVNTKRSAEKVAEEIAKKYKKPTPALIELSDKILNAIPKSTKQCQRLAFCVRNGIAFHHAGLHSKQKELVENAFRSGIIKIIGCTPTLAAGCTIALSSSSTVNGRTGSRPLRINSPNAGCWRGRP